MPSPFPGMDPFLEEGERWNLFHAWFVREIAQYSISDVHKTGCYIDVERDIYTRDASGEVVLLGAPDEVVGFTWSSDTPSWKDDSGTGVALAEPQAIHEVVLTEDEALEHRQDYLVIREQKYGNPIVAVIEVLSPANKSGSYREKYRDKRTRLLASHVHFMEIDFLREGSNPARQQFPELEPTPYFILVARQHGAGRTEEGYPIRLQEELPIVGLPLGGGRPDLPIDLPTAFKAAYDLSVQNRLDYRTESVPGSLTDADREWVHQQLQTLR